MAEVRPDVATVTIEMSSGVIDSTSERFAIAAKTSGVAVTEMAFSTHSGWMLVIFFWRPRKSRFKRTLPCVVVAFVLSSVMTSFCRLARVPVRPLRMSALSFIRMRKVSCASGGAAASVACSTGSVCNNDAVGLAKARSVWVPMPMPTRPTVSTTTATRRESRGMIRPLP